jgi:hypothetical protein
MSQIIKCKTTIDEQFDLAQALLAWAAEHDLSMEDVCYLSNVASCYLVACRDKGVPALVSASGVAGARVRARARDNKRGHQT